MLERSSARCGPPAESCAALAAVRLFAGSAIEVFGYPIIERPWILSTGADSPELRSPTKRRDS